MVAEIGAVRWVAEAVLWGGTVEVGEEIPRVAIEEEEEQCQDVAGVDMASLEAAV